MHDTSIPKTLHTLVARVKISSFVLAFLLLVIGHAHAETPIETTLGKMSAEQKVGQTMIWSFIGNKLSPEIQVNLAKYQPGGLIAFRSNITSLQQISKLNTDLQKYAAKNIPAPLFLMIDQEGGLVTRIRTTTPTPSALALARMGDVTFVENYGKATADVLNLLGFNVNLAPVLDVSSPQRDSFIGNRTFGEDPASVSEIAFAYSKGLSAGGLLPTAKHFPGHGGTLQDSHQTTPKKLSSLDELKTHDFVPFTDFIDGEFPKAIMMAHLALPKVDASGIPATYSTPIIQDQLRGALEYDGLVMTDDLEMTGANMVADIGERAVRAFLAGNDMLMLAGSPAHQKKAYAAMLTAVRDGRIPSSRLDESVTRILEAKASYKAPPKLTEKAVVSALNRLNDLSKQALKHNFKVAAQNAKPNWPEITSQSHAKVFSGSYMFFKKFQTKFKGKTTFFELRPDTLEKVKSDLASSRMDFGVFFASGDHTAHWLKNLAPDLKAKLIVVNCNHPGEIADQEAFMSVFNLNTYFTDSATWLAEMLNQPAPEIRMPASEESHSHQPVSSASTNN